MSLVSEFKFPYESPFTPFTERISDGPDSYFFSNKVAENKVEKK